MTNQNPEANENRQATGNSAFGVNRRQLIGGVGATALGFATGYQYRKISQAKASTDLKRRQEFHQRALAITEAHRKQTAEQVVSLKTKYEQPVYGKVLVWDLIEKLGQCIDTTDGVLGGCSQYLHIQQALVSMEQAGVVDSNLLLIALIHDLGKVFLLTDEVPENILCPSARLGESEPGCGLDSVVYQFGHAELIYSRIKDHVPEAVSWTARYHNLDIADAEAFMNDRDKKFAEAYLKPFRKFDVGSKSPEWVPTVNMDRYRSLIHEFFPEPILF